MNKTIITLWGVLAACCITLSTPAWSRAQPGATSSITPVADAADLAPGDDSMARPTHLRSGQKRHVRRKITADALAKGVYVDSVCVDATAVLRSGQAIEAGCYHLYVYVLAQMSLRQDTPSFIGRLRYVDRQSQKIAADIEAKRFEMGEASESASAPMLEFNAEVKERGIFDNIDTPAICSSGDAPFEGLVASSKRSLTCMGTCQREACAICGYDHVTSWDDDYQVCRTRSLAAATCVTNTGGSCWDQRCNLAKFLLDSAIKVTGLFGLGGPAGRAIRFFW